ncbi:MAG: SHOCT domain-containing protein [Desulfovibrionaceae bacterium]
MNAFLASWGNGICNWGYGGGPGGGWHMPFMGGPLMLLLVVVAVVVAVRLFQRRDPQRETTAPCDAQRESPLDVLRKRYAAGEIDKDRYESMRKDIAL